MSTDHQKHSAGNLLAILRSSAASRGLQTLCVFESSGVSGLRLEGWEALQNLIG